MIQGAEEQETRFLSLQVETPLQEFHCHPL